MKQISTWEGFYYPLTDRGVVYGDMIAGHDFINAVLQYGRYDQQRFFTVSEYATRNSQDEIAPIKNQLSQHNDVQLLPHVEAFRQPSTPNSVFHEVWRHKYWGAHYLRSLRPGPVYPITRTSHSSWFDADGYYYSLMNNAVHTFDSVVCSSAPAQAVTRNIMQQTAERVSHSQGREVSYPGRVDMIPLGIDTDKFCPRDQEEARRSFGIDIDEFIILWVGRVSALSKGDLIPLLPVIARLIERNPDEDVNFYVAGMPEQPYGSRLTALAEQFGLRGKVKFVQDVTPDKRHLIYNIADVFVSPVDHIQECFGLTPLEALASGVPQVVSEWDGYRDTVVHGETGFLIPTHLPAGDLERSSIAVINEAMLLPEQFDGFALAQNVVVDMDAYEHYLNLLINDNHLRHKMSQASRARALDIYPWKNTIESYRQLWDELSEQASHYENKDQKKSNPYHYLSARWEADFYTPFATQQVDDETVFTKGSVDFSNISDCLQLFPAVELGVANTEHISNICKNIPEQSFRVTAIIALVPDATEADIQRNLMWLVKMGLLKIVNNS